MSNIILSSKDANGIIERPNLLRVAVKRTTTKDGLGQLAKHIKEGQEFWVDRDTLRHVEITNADGHKHKKMIINPVDENGRHLDWVYAECFFIG